MRKQLYLAEVLILCVLPIFLLGRSDTFIFYQWYIFIAVLGAASLPLANIIFDKSKELFVFGKILGIFIPGFIMWFLGNAGVPFNHISALSIVMIYISINIIIASKNDMTFPPLEKILKYEVIFFLLLLFWTYLIGFNPDAYGTEKFMDYGFLQKMLISDKLPPEDMWYAGENINYYYGGQYFAAFITKAGILTKAEYTYNMVRSLIPALTSMGVFAFAKQLIIDKSKSYGIKSNLFSLLSAAVVTFAGNGHYIIYGLIQPLFRIGRDSYWFPDATRYIGYDPLIENDQTIHEFPSYSFVLGDLHAHMLNIIFVLLLLAVLYSFVQSWKTAQLFTIGVLWGSFTWINHWDYVIYIVVIVLAIIFFHILYEPVKKAVMLSSIQIGGIVITGILAAAPFTLSFVSIFKGVGITQHHSAFYQLAVLWSVPIVMSVIFIVTFFIKLSRKKKIPSDIFVFILVGCAIGLVLIPEFIYVRDIYETTHPRANTMFKLTYQAFILFGISSGYILYSFFEKESVIWKTIAYVLITINLLTLGYFFNAANAWFQSWTNPSSRKGIYALDYLEKDFQGDQIGLLWLKNKVESGEISGVIAEATGDSYTGYGRVSTVTGLSTVIGWKVHEWLWRDDYDAMIQRVEDIDQLYENGDRDIIEKYDIDYIFYGEKEKEKYGENHVADLGNVIFKNNDVIIYKVGRANT